MQADIRETVLYREAEALYKALHQPGTGQISDAAEIHVAASSHYAVFAGTLMDTLEGAPPTRICQVDLTSGETCVLTFGPNTDRLPKYSPDGRQIAFLSDRHRAGDFQLYLLDAASGAARPASPVEGWVEYLHWSPDGTRILLGVAGYGADIAGGQGAVTSKRVAEEVPSWMPAVETGHESFRWRRAWVYELASGQVRQVSHPDANVWEAAWCGNTALAAVVSPEAAEGLWYSASLHVVDIETGKGREIYKPQDQLGWPTASSAGTRVAVVEALCSDRGLVAGDLRLIDTASGSVRTVDTRGVDVTYTEWRSDRQLLLAGHRGFETVVAVFDADSGTFIETWSSREVTAGGRYVAVSGLNELGDCVLVAESFVRAPEVALIRSGEYQLVKSFDLGYADQVRAVHSVACVRWRAPDGLQIQGWLLRPKGAAPFPLVMNVHGGPVWHWRPLWLGRSRGIPILMLIKRGYAVFFPNPRGSSGRGQSFVRHVLGEMGGADTHDYLSGLDHLVEKGIAARTSLGVMGVSYGGFMSAWLITQDSRFTAAVAVAPVTNHVTQQLISNIPHFVELFLADRYNNPDGKYFERSPVMYAQKVKTPTLNICGALDRCTPPEEAVQFHNALLQHGIESVLITYPQEGHGVRKLPAAIDYACRVVSWFVQHIDTSMRSADVR